MTPYISVILAARNDNYGENFLLRLNTFIKSLDHQTQTYPDLVELVIVEWNPPNDTQPLFEVIERSCNYKTRVITVSNEAHQTFQTKLPMLEFQAKNVGSRRANGQFVLITNPDILFSQELVDKLSKRNLCSTTLYRTDRYDYRPNGIENLAPTDYIDHAIRNTFTGHLTKGSHSVSPVISDATSMKDLPVTTEDEGFPHTNASGDFLLVSKDAFFLTTGLIEVPESMTHLDSYSLCRFLGTGYKQEVLKSPECIFHMDHKRRAFTNAFDFALAYKLLTRQSTELNKTIDWGLENMSLQEWSNHI